MAKKPESQNFIDMFANLGKDLKLPSVDVEQVIEHHRKNLEALQKSASTASSGAATVMARQREMLEEIEVRKKKGLQNNNLATSRLLRQIVSVDGVTDRNALSKFVQALPITDSKALRKFINNHQPDIKMQFFFECESCGHVEKEAPLPMGASFFWPDE